MVQNSVPEKKNKLIIKIGIFFRFRNYALNVKVTTFFLERKSFHLSINGPVSLCSQQRTFRDIVLAKINIISNCGVNRLLDKSSIARFEPNVTGGSNGKLAFTVFGSF